MVIIKHLTFRYQLRYLCENPPTQGKEDSFLPI